MAWIWARLGRHRAVLAALGVSALGLLAWPGLWRPAPRASWADIPLERPANDEAWNEYVGRVAFAPDGRSVLVFDEAVARLRNLETGRSFELIPGEARAGALRFINPLSLEGGRSWLGYLQVDESPGVNHHELRVWEAATGRELFRSPKVGDSSAESNYVLSEDGSTLAYPPRYPPGKYGPPMVGVWKAAFGREPRTFPGVDPVALSGDGKTLAAVEPGTPSGPIGVWDVESGRRLATIPAEPTQSTRCLALSFDGKRLAENRMPGVVLWGVPTSTRRAALDSKTWPSRFGAGDAVLYQGNLAYQQEATDEAWDLTRDPPRRFYEGNVLHVSDDGRRVMLPSTGFSGGPSESREAVEGPVEIRRMALPSWPAMDLSDGPGATSFSTDGRFVAKLGFRWERSWFAPLARRLPRWLGVRPSGNRQVYLVRVTDVVSGRQLAEVDLPDGTMESAEFSPVEDGRGLAVRYHTPEGKGARVELWDVPVPPPKWPIALGLASAAIVVGLWTDARRRLAASASS